MIEAGVPPCFWSYACPCFCVNYNTEKIKDESPWHSLWDHEFPGARFPFGSAVIFQPTSQRVEGARWDAPGRIGVFAGYKIHPGYSWHGEYLVWELTSFRRADLWCSSTRHNQSNVGTPHVTRMCELPVDGLTFPLKADYDRINTGHFDPRITVEDYDPWEIAELARGAEIATKNLPDDIIDDIEGPPNIAPPHHVPLLPPVVPLQPYAAESPMGTDVIAERIDPLKHRHFHHGIAGDGIVYVNDTGRTVKLDKSGRPYPVGSDGWRVGKGSSRPLGMDPDAWAAIRPVLLREGKTYAEWAQEREILKGSAAT